MTMRSRLAVAMVLCPLAAAALGFVSFAVQTPRFPYPLDYGEGMILDEASLLGQGRNIYPPAPASPPYLIPSYPPLLMAIEAPLTRWFGAAYWYGRLIAQLSAVAAAVAIGMVVLATTGSRASATIAALTLLAIPAFSITSQFNRVDTLALALASAAMACVASRTTAGRLAAAGTLLVAAGFTRQTAWLPAGLAIVAHLCAKRDVRKAAIFACAVAASALVIGAVLQAKTGGFLFAVTRSTTTRLSMAHAAEVMGPALSAIPVFLVALAAGVAVGARRKTRWAPLLIAFTVGALPELAGSAAIGSSTNYVFALAAAAALGTGFCWSLLDQDAVRGSVRRIAIALLVAQAAWCAWRDRPFRLVAAPYLAEVEQVIEATDGPVLADETLGLLPLAEKHIWLEPFKMSELARAGKWDEAPFLADLRRRRFALILLRARADGTLDRQPWTEDAWQAMLTNYRPCGGVSVDADRRILFYRPPSAGCATGARQ